MARKNISSVRLPGAAPAFGFEVAALADERPLLPVVNVQPFGFDGVNWVLADGARTLANSNEDDCAGRPDCNAWSLNYRAGSDGTAVLQPAALPVLVPGLVGIERRGAGRGRGGKRQSRAQSVHSRRKGGSERPGGAKRLKEAAK